jgi:alkylhydroperoxidase family enzyme
MMAWIKMVTEEEAEGELADLYKKYRSRESGMMDHILKIHSLDPPTMVTHIQMYRNLMFGPSELSRKEREMIAVVVSVENSCHY